MRRHIKFTPIKMGDSLFKEASTLFVGKEVARGQDGPYGGCDELCG